MKFDELDCFVEDLFNRAAPAMWEEEPLEACSGAANPSEASAAGGGAVDQAYESYYWREPEEPAWRPEGAWTATATTEWQQGEPLGIWGTIKGLLLLAAGLLLIMGLSEAGVF